MDAQIFSVVTSVTRILCGLLSKKQIAEWIACLTEMLIAAPDAIPSNAVLLGCITPQSSAPPSVASVTPLHHIIDISQLQTEQPANNISDDDEPLVPRPNIAIPNRRRDRVQCSVCHRAVSRDTMARHKKSAQCARNSINNGCMIVTDEE